MAAVPRHQQRARWAALCLMLGTWLVVVEGEDAAGLPEHVGDLGEGAQVAVKGPGDYKKHAKVPTHLTVFRKLVTASWVRCKKVCDKDKGCAGFKFTPMANKQLPLCELLTTQGGNFMKNDFKAKEHVMKKMKVVRELLEKARATHRRAVAAAVDAQSRLSKVGKKLNAGNQKIKQSHQKIKQSQLKEKHTKKNVRSAEKRLKELHDKLGIKKKHFDKAEKLIFQEKATKAKNKLKGAVMKTEEQAKREIEENAAKMAAKKAKQYSKMNGAFNSVEERLKAQKEKLAAEAAKLAERKRRGDMKKLLEQHLMQQQDHVMELKTKVLHVKLELKYKDNPKQLKQEKERANKEYRKRKGQLRKQKAKAQNREGNEITEKMSLGNLKTGMKNVKSAEKGFEKDLLSRFKALQKKMKSMQNKEGKTVKKALTKEERARLAKVKAAAKAESASKENRKKILRSKLLADKSQDAKLKAQGQEKIAKGKDSTLKRRFEKLKKKGLLLKANAKKFMTKAQEEAHKMKHHERFSKMSAEEKALFLKEKEYKAAKTKEAALAKKRALNTADTKYAQIVKAVNKAASAKDLSFEDQHVNAGMSLAMHSMKIQQDYKLDLQKVLHTTTSAEVKAAMQKMRKKWFTVLDKVARLSASTAAAYLRQHLKDEKSRIKTMSGKELQSEFSSLKQQLKAEKAKYKKLSASQPTPLELAHGYIAELTHLHSQAAVARLEKRIDAALLRVTPIAAKVIQREQIKVADASFTMQADRIRKVSSIEAMNKLLKKIADKTAVVGKAIAREKEISKLREKVAADTQGGEPLKKLKRDLRVKVLMFHAHHHKYTHAQIRKVLSKYKRLQRGKKELARIKKEIAAARTGGKKISPDLAAVLEKRLQRLLSKFSPHSKQSMADLLAKYESVRKNKLDMEDMRKRFKKGTAGGKKLAKSEADVINKKLDAVPAKVVAPKIAAKPGKARINAVLRNFKASQDMKASLAALKAKFASATKGSKKLPAAEKAAMLKELKQLQAKMPKQSTTQKLGEISKEYHEATAGGRALSPALRYTLLKKLNPLESTKPSLSDIEGEYEAATAGGKKLSKELRNALLEKLDAFAP
jgi:hypothetical protein